MSVLTLLPKLLPVVSLALLTASPAAQDPEREWPQPEAYHLGAYSTRLAARIDLGGVIDTGLVRARVVRAPGEPVDFEPLHVLVARLTALGGWFEGDVGVGLSAFGIDHAAGGDERLLVPAQLRFENLGAETVELRMGVELTAGAGTGLDRPWGARDFPGTATFTREGKAVLRDGHVVLSWRGSDPEEVVVAGEVDDPDAVGARVTWVVTLEPGSVRRVGFNLAGPPVGDATDDAAWLASASRQTHDLLEEELSWQSGYLGEAVAFYPADNLLRWMVLGGQQLIRSQGVAHERVEWLTDRPFGHPPSDAAAPAELLAALFEWGLASLGDGYLTTLLDEARERGAELSPARRLAYVHGLARCLRLAATPDPRSQQLAELILDWVREPVAVAPWHDPEHVRADLLEVFDDAGRERPDDLPELRWAQVSDPDSVEGRFLAHRRALSSGDRVAAWARLQELMLVLAPQGYGAMTIEGVPSARFAQAGMTAARETVVDDHGGRMEIFPGADYGIVERTVPMKSSPLPTRYGVVRPEMYYAGRRNLGGRVVWQKNDREPSETLYHFIGSAVGHGLGQTEGGRVRKVSDDTLEVVQYGPFAPLGLRFSMRVDPHRAVD